MKERSTEEKGILDFITSITGGASLRIEEKLPFGFVRLKIAEAERRQAHHDIRSVEDAAIELVRNSRDAGAKNVLLGFQKIRSRFRVLTVIDDGEGIPKELHKLVFEPRVTSRSEAFEEDVFGVHGRGMALFSMLSTSEEMRINFSEPGLGSIITARFDTTRVPEKADQATVAKLEHENGREYVGAGPHNVARVLLVMSLYTPGVNFYIGSFSEILATARELATNSSERTIWSEISRPRNAAQLAEAVTKRYGINISERNAYRIINGDVRPLKPVLEIARSQSEPPDPVQEVKKGHAPSRKRTVTFNERNALKKLSTEDMLEISSETGAVVERILERYYLRPSERPNVKRGRNKLVISFYVTGKDDM